MPRASRVWLARGVTSKGQGNLSISLKLDHPPEVPDPESWITGRFTSVV